MATITLFELLNSKITIGETDKVQPKVEKKDNIEDIIARLKAAGYEITKSNTSSNKKKSNTKPADNKSAANKKGTASRGSNKKLTFGNVVKNGYFKMFNLKDKNNPVLVGVGKALEVSKKDSTITYVKDGSDRKMVALENCVAIDKKEFDKLSKNKALKHYFARQTNSKQLSHTDFKSVYALYLSKNGKITPEEFAKANSDQDFATELYDKFSRKEGIKLSNADALKLFAEELKNSSAKAN